MSNIVDLNLCGIKTSEEFGSADAILFVVASPIQDDSAVGYGAIYSNDVTIQSTPHVVSLDGLGIPSGEDFRSLQKIPPIASEEQFGTFLVKRVVRTVSIQSLASVPAPAFKNILAYGIPTREAVPAPTIAQTNDKPGNNILIASQFPSFVGEDHPRFLTFVEAYYKWMETKGNVLYETKRLKSIS